MNSFTNGAPDYPALVDQARVGRSVHTLPCPSCLQTCQGGETVDGVCVCLYISIFSWYRQCSRLFVLTADNFPCVDVYVKKGTGNFFLF